MRNQRLDTTSSERISVLRFPLIVGVVFHHAYSAEVELAEGTVGVAQSGHVSELIRNLISQGVARTAVELFFLMAGYLFFLGFSWSLANYRRKLKRRVRTLLIPFLFWNALFLAFLALTQHFPATRVYFSGRNPPVATFGAYDYANALIGIDTYPILYQFWFLRDLMVMIVLVPAIHVIMKIAPTVFLAGILSAWFLDLWPVYTPCVTAVAFFYAGAYCSCSRISIFALDRFGPALLSSYAVLLLVDVFTKGHELNRYVQNAAVLLGVASALYLSKALVATQQARRFFLWASGGSFFLFAVHEPLLTMLRKLAYRAVTPSSDLAVLSLYFAIPVLVIAVSVLLYTAIKSIAPRLLAVVTGGR